ARAQLTKNRAVLSGRRANFVYLLSGLLRCEACGGRYASDPSHGWRCYRHRRAQDVACRTPQLAADRYEALVWTTLVKALRNPETFREAAIRHEDSRGARRSEERRVGKEWSAE